MQASELIKQLQQLIEQHGDLYCEDSTGSGVTVEFNDDDAENGTEPVFLVS